MQLTTLFAIQSVPIVDTATIIVRCAVSAAAQYHDSSWKEFVNVDLRACVMELRDL
jgi:hypothetical protein